MQAVHNFFKQGPPLPQLETTTVLDPNNTDASNPSSVICVEQRKGRGRKRGRGAQADAAGRARKQHIRETWPGGGSNFCRFVLGKCNMDTQVGSAGTVTVTWWPLQYRQVRSSWQVCSACSRWLSTGSESEVPCSINIRASSAVVVALSVRLRKLHDPLSQQASRMEPAQEWKQSDLCWLGCRHVNHLLCTDWQDVQY